MENFLLDHPYWICFILIPYFGSMIALPYKSVIIYFCFYDNF